jgi:tRNA (guanine-N7-)-methyltransferase
MRVGGKIYVVTDVKDLFDWEVRHMEGHPLLEKVPDEETKEDPCVKFMCEDTDEARKVIRNEGSIWHAVFRKRDVND